MKNPGDEPVVGLPFEFRVAGTGYERRYTAIRRYCAKQSVLRLIPEHGNPFDRNAIAVHMAWKNVAGVEIWEMIGYVPAEASATINELLASGEWAIEQAFVRSFDASAELDSPKVVARLEGRDLRLGKERA